MEFGATIGTRRPHASTSELILRWRVALVAALLVLAGLAWWSTGVRMAGMDAGPGTDPGALGFYITTWVVMMAAMMFPSIAPMVLMYAGIQRGRRAQGIATERGSIVAFVGGYLLLWGLVGFVGYAVLKLGRSLDGGFFAWDRAGRWTAAGVLAAAALYELTPAKNVCLRHCRGPVGFLMEHWRDGRVGALRMGLVHGGWCVGCCWALMAALFALGAMSVGWMAFVAALIAAEKLVPWRLVAVGGVAALLAALAIWVAAAPGSVPGLTIPTDVNGMSMQGGSMHGMSKPAHSMGSDGMSH